MPPTTTAEVRLSGSMVGELAFARGGSSFQYLDDLRAPSHRVLGQIFEDDPASVRRVSTGLPAWFANLLPEGALRAYVERSLGPGRTSDPRLLLRLGLDLPGAVTVHAEREPDDADHQAPPSSAGTAEHPLRHSLAGVQLKFSVRADRLTFPASGNGGWWIVKLPDPSFPDLPVNEYLTMTWLRLAGLDVPPVRLHPARTVQDTPKGLVRPDDLVFLIPRFDREPGGSVHVEDFAQVADVGPMFKYRDAGISYDGIGAVVLRLTGTAGLTEYVRRLTAMVVVGNTDAHLKNWALIYRDGRTPELSPVFDFHSLTIDRTNRYRALALTLGGEEMPSLVVADNFKRFAEHAGTDTDAVLSTVAETVHSLRTAWRDVREEASGRFPALAEHYTRRLGELPVCRL